MPKRCGSHRLLPRSCHELMRLAWIEPLVITCTCLPRSCHAQIVAEYIERLRKELATLHAALPADVDQDDDGF
jgi:hypothetical protein